MELSTFISSSLEQIISGVQEAQEKVREYGGEVNPENVEDSDFPVAEVRGTKACVINVGFDVAVMVDEDTETKGALGLWLACLLLEPKENLQMQVTL